MTDLVQEVSDEEMRVVHLGPRDCALILKEGEKGEGDEYSPINFEQIVPENLMGDENAVLPTHIVFFLCLFTRLKDQEFCLDIIKSFADKSSGGEMGSTAAEDYADRTRLEADASTNSDYDFVKTYDIPIATFGPPQSISQPYVKSAFTPKWAHLTFDYS